MLGPILKQINEALKDVNKNPEIFFNIARTCSKLVKALEKEGFTREEAMEILKSSLRKAS